MGYNSGMKNNRNTLVLGLTLVMVGGMGPCALAQTDDAGEDGLNSPNEREISYTLDVYGRVAFETDLGDGPSDVGVQRIGTAFTVGVPIEENMTLILSPSFEYSHYDFDKATGLIAGTADPFEDLTSSSMTARLEVKQDDTWGWFVGAMVISSLESGADFGDSLTAGAGAGVSYQINDRSSIGFGVGMRTRLEDDVIVYPVIYGRHEFNDQWALTSSGSAATGGGMALVYDYSETLAFALSGTWEFREYRLDDGGALPDGVMTDQRIPVGLGVRWKAEPNLTINAEVGVFAWQEFQIDNSSGDEISDDNPDATAYVSFGVSYKF